MVKFLSMFKENNSTGYSYKTVVTLRQQLFWEFASALRNVFKLFFRKLRCQHLACNKS